MKCLLVVAFSNQPKVYKLTYFILISRIITRLSLFVINIGKVHLITLGLSVLVVVASSVFLMSTGTEELQGPVGIWATCMVVGTLILGILAFIDGSKTRRFNSQHNQQEKDQDVWRIMYVQLSSK